MTYFNCPSGKTPRRLLLEDSCYRLESKQFVSANEVFLVKY